ncbi:MAG: fimbrillin family protein [Duncaniella sp.]|nr:fimbrillin family protein [Muribaculum sp.]MCM1256059.1 fimbrillin family protein [Duncaniella sp.]
MHFYIKLILPIILPLTFVSCSDTPEAPHYNEAESIHLELNPIIAPTAERTRAAVSSSNGKLSKGSYNFGVYIYRFVDNDTTKSHYPHNESLINFLAKYNTDGTNSSWQYNIDDYIYNFLSVQPGIPYDVYAYHPYTNEAVNPERVPFDTSKTDDWLVSDKVLVKANQTNGVNDKITVPLKFSHIMTCLQINVRTKYETYPYVTKVTLSDSKSRIVTKGHINILTKEITADEEASMIEQTYGGNLYLIKSGSSFLYIFPEINNVEEGDLKFKLTYQKRNSEDKQQLSTEYTLPFSFSDGNKIVSLERGKKYVYNLMLDHVFTFDGIAIDEEGEWSTTEKSDLII